jgi:polyisoprenoid-binding protein YceI
MKRLLIALPLLANPGVHATEFTRLQVDKSSIAFVSKQMNVPVNGVFKKFTATIGLNPARPEMGHARVEIELASLDTGSDDANEEVKGKDWFHVREFPKASFVSNSVKTLGGGKFEVAGKMSIKGRTLDLRAPFTLKQEKDSLTLDGAFPVKRLDYAIGSGSWSDTSVVADEVLVKFHFILK